MLIAAALPGHCARSRNACSPPGAGATGRVDLRTLRHAGVSVIEMLQGSDLLRRLDRKMLKVIARASSLVGVTEGTLVMTEGEPGDGLFMVVSGRLQVLRSGTNGAPVVLGEVSSGEVVGEGSLLTEEPRHASVRATTDSLLIRLPRREFQLVREKYPENLQPLVALISARQASEHRARLRPVSAELIEFLRTVPLFASMSGRQLRELEGQLQWLHLPAGKTLMKQGDEADGLYVVVGGRLRFEVNEESASATRSGSFGRGDIIGELALVTGERRAATVTALRDCELVRLTQAAVKRLLRRAPRVVLALTRTIAERLNRPARSHRDASFTSLALIPISPSVHIAAFGAALAHSLERFGRVCRVNAAAVDSALGPGSAQAGHEERRGDQVLDWLASREETHDFVLLEGSADTTAWSERCIRSADRVLLVADAKDEPHLAPVEVRYLGPRSVLQVPRELVLIQAADCTVARGTHRFLEPRPVEQHHHLRRNSSADLERLSRNLTGRSIGLVLGGGGARGMAHVGIIEALLDGGIPIDRIAGTSAGALIGALYARAGETNSIRTLIQRHLIESNPLNDYTFPFVSLVRGRKYSRALQQVLGDTAIEDLLIPFFALSCNLTLSEEAVFDAGPAWKAVRASTSLPGIVPPLFEKGQLFVDGGLLNNLPIDRMRERGAGRILAVDVSGARTRQDEMYARLVGGPSATEGPPFLRALANRLRRKSKRIELPSLGSVLVRSTMIGSVSRVKQAKREADIYARLPVERFGLLDWQSAGELVGLGREYATENLPLWKPKLLEA